MRHTKTLATGLFFLGTIIAPASQAAPINLSTGAADWSITRPDGSASPANEIQRNPNWASTDEARWIGPADGTADAPVGEYVYSLSFSLFGSQSLEVVWSSDNAGALSLFGSDGEVQGAGTTETAGRGTFAKFYTADFDSLAAGDYTLSASIVNWCSSNIDSTDCGRDEWNPTGFIASANAASGSLTQIPVPASLWLMLGALGLLAGSRLSVRS